MFYRVLSVNPADRDVGWLLVATAASLRIQLRQTIFQTIAYEYESYLQPYPARHGRLRKLGNQISAIFMWIIWSQAC